MSYLVQAILAEDGNIMKRVTACVASEGITNPSGWAYEHAWQLSAQPGWAEAYKHALDNGVDDPGADEAVITDGMILSAVQALLAEE